jgi:signal transduction histidine kinase
MNDLRHRKKTAEQLILPLTDRNIPAVRAALGEEGNFDGVDYRGVPVISSTRIIPGTHWGMVVKIDRSEVLAPLSKYTIYVIISGLLIASAMTLGVFLYTIRRKALTLQAQLELQKKNEAVLQGVHAQLEQQILVRTKDLSDINSLLRKEMVERKQLEHQLLDSKKLEAIGQIAGGVAHEVRNPLNAILTVTEALFREKEIEDNPEFKPYIRHIKTQVTRLVHLMNDLLDLGRTIPESNLLPIPLYKICEEALALWKSTGMAKYREGVFIAEDNNVSCIVLADDVKLQQVFFNLLENAGHHSTSGDSIIMKLACHGDCNSNGMAVVQIIDHGTGIAEGKLAHVFDPFFTDRRGGTGLGLALVKHFTENMGGTVQIRNNIPPPGCTVEVTMPLNREETR